MRPLSEFLAGSWAIQQLLSSWISPAVPQQSAQ